MPRQETHHKIEPSQAKNIPIATVGLLLVALTIGIVATVSLCIESLQDNAKELNRLHVKPGPSASGQAVEVAVSDGLMPNLKDVPAESKMRVGQAKLMYSRGLELMKAGDYANAIASFTRCHHILGNEIQKNYLDDYEGAGIDDCFSALSECYFRMGNLEAAEKEITMAIADRSAEPAFYLQRAKILQKMGDGRRAAADRKRASQMHPTPAHSDVETFDTVYGQGAPSN